MRHIERNAPSTALQQFLAECKSSPEWRHALDSGDVEKVRNYFDGLSKDLIRTELWESQHHVCAYCNRRIYNDNHSVIEHILPLSLYPEHALDFSNMVLCCDGGRHLESIDGRRSLCCDASKGQDELAVLNPLVFYPEQHIMYDRKTLLMDVDEKDSFHDEIFHDIDLLRLNGYIDSSGNLKDTTSRILYSRNQACESVKVLIDKMKKRNEYTPACIDKEIRKLINMPEWTPFIGVIIYFLEKERRKSEFYKARQ